MRSVKKLPTSGSEVVFRAMPWGSPKGIRTANCYAFALDSYDERRTEKSQPGDVAARRRGYRDRHHEVNVTGASETRELACEALQRKVLDDLQSEAYIEHAERPCRSGYYKIMMAVARGNGNGDRGDFHYYKNHKDVIHQPEPGQSAKSVARLYQVPMANVQSLRDGNLYVSNAGVWSHKMGHATGGLLKDSCGRPIFDPRKACRTSGTLTYRKVCNSFCVKSQRHKKLPI